MNNYDTDDLLINLRSLSRDLRDEVRALRNEVNSLREELTGGKEKDNNALLDREEAAEVLGISVRTLDDMAEAGEIQPVRIRGRVLYAPETLEAYIRRRAGEGVK